MKQAWALPLLTLACGEQPQDSTAPPPPCAPGHLEDQGTCVPESCGLGLWGDLPVDEATVYVDAAAANGGDGSAEDPLRSVQAGLDLAGERGGGLVAVAAGTYAEVLELTSTHDGVQLAGRCRDLVVLDASVGDFTHFGLTAYLDAAEAEVSGLTIRDAASYGLVLGSGRLKLRDAAVIDSAEWGIYVTRTGLVPTTLEAEDCLLQGNQGVSVTAVQSGTSVSLTRTTIRGTKLEAAHDMGYALNAFEGASLTAVDCLLDDNATAAVHAANPGTLIKLEGSTISGTRPNSVGEYGVGVWAWDAASVELVDCQLSGNTATGILAKDADTAVTLQGTEVQATRPDSAGQGGAGIMVGDGASLDASGCAIVGNTVTGVTAQAPGSRVSLTDCIIQDTQPGADDWAPCGAGAYDGARLVLDGCSLMRNASTGIIVSDSNVSLRGTTVADTLPDHNGDFGYGIEILDGALVDIEACDLVGNTGAGISIAGLGTRAQMRASTVRGTHWNPDGAIGGGIYLWDEAILEVSGCSIEDNTTAGIAVNGARAILQDTTVRGTQPMADGRAGNGILLFGGGALLARDLLVTDNTEVGVLVSGCAEGDPDACSSAYLERSTLQLTAPRPIGGWGYGLMVHEGANLAAEDLTVRHNRGIGIVLNDPGTTARFHALEVLDTQPGEEGYGLGLEVLGGAGVAADAIRLEGNSVFGILADGDGTTVTLDGGRIAGTLLGTEEAGSTAPGMGAQQGATIAAHDLEIASNEGPGLSVVSEGSSLSCTGCSITDNRFAGAVAIAGGTLTLDSSTISGTLGSANLGGGAGIYAAELDGLGPTASVQDCLITDNEVAGIQLSGSLLCQLSDTTITGSSGLPHGPTTRCGDGVYATGTSAWDGSTGLLLSGNTISGNSGAGLFLDDAYATLDGNTWSDNDPDLLAQGMSCAEPQPDWAEAPEQDICPQWSQPTCFDPFSFALILDELEAGLPPPPIPLRTPLVSR